MASDPVYLVLWERSRRTVTKVVVSTTIPANPVTTVCVSCSYQLLSDQRSGKKEHEMETDTPGSLAKEEQRGVRDGDLLR